MEHIKTEKPEIEKTKLKLCSACLLGISCRYDAQFRIDKKTLELSKKEHLIPVCPEQLGGMLTPRTPSEIAGGSGEDVLDGKIKVLNKNGEDVTAQFIRGAEEVLKIAKIFNIEEAILKQKSPSCGFGKIGNGKFLKKLVPGNGVTAALLNRNGIKVITEEDL